MAYPKKIVSLVPSLTELLFNLGMGNRVVGRTRFCIHPENEVSEVEIIGGTKNPRIEKIRELSPDLVIANKEENRKNHVKEIEKFADVLITEISNINEALFTIHLISEACGVESKAEELMGDIQAELEKVPDEPLLTAAYLIWRDPWMTIGSDTYIHSVMDHWNLENVWSNEGRYPKFSLDELEKKHPDVILLSSEPYPFKEKHIAEVKNASPGSDVVLVNGEWFSWYGSRMLPSFRQLNIFRKAIA